jgi:hypothetical protein
VATQTINEEKLEGFMNQLVGELGATVGAALSSRAAGSGYGRRWRAPAA